MNHITDLNYLKNSWAASYINTSYSSLFNEQILAVSRRLCWFEHEEARRHVGRPYTWFMSAPIVYDSNRS